MVKKTVHGTALQQQCAASVLANQSFSSAFLTIASCQQGRGSLVPLAAQRVYKAGSSWPVCGVPRAGQVSQRNLNSGETTMSLLVLCTTRSKQHWEEGERVFAFWRDLHRYEESHLQDCTVFFGRWAAVILPLPHC